MKRKCKNVDICNIDLIRKAVQECLKSCKKRKRNDTIYMFRHYLPGFSKGRAIQCLRSKDDNYFRVCELIAQDLQKAIIEENLELDSPKNKRKS